MEEKLIYVIIFFTVIYFISIIASINVVKASIEEYIRKSSGIISKKMIQILDSNKNLLIVFGSILFPLYYCFRFGFFIGGTVYDILIDNDYENRLASWVI